MHGLRETREFLLTAYQDGDIDDIEFCLLYDMNRSKNIDYPYWCYDPFQLYQMDDSECWSKFRFYKNDIYRLKDALQIPDVVRTYNRMAVNGEEALCIFLKRFSFPCRYSDLIPRFGRLVPAYSIITSTIMEHIHISASNTLTISTYRFSNHVTWKDIAKLSIIKVLH